jgi:hypothetical protein
VHDEGRGKVRNGRRWLSFIIGGLYEIKENKRMGKSRGGTVRELLAGQMVRL